MLLTGTDGKISDLEALDTVNVQSLVENTVLDDAVALARRHAARAKRVPGRLNVALDPLLDVLDVFLGVFEVFVQVLLVRGEPVDIGLLAGLEWHGPGAL